ncbi:hypothetical protein HMPREF9477_00188 [Lachnospiraceae bacterium 2_1_46FAA]|nr:hypothetical protein HMPREF9477_00188 [Lachnospiraceae bacterium 2_1_46FAA]
MASEKRQLTQQEKAAKQRLHVAAELILIGIPIALIVGIKFLPREWYMLLSLSVLAMTIAPFFMVFESRKPKAREIVLLAMMSALVVASHLFFHIVFPIQIGTALIIISGISLGPEAGFFIGALSRLVCNFYMGQGPWTPWQMVCWGILGFLAGFAFNCGNKETLKSRNFKMIAGPVLTILFSLLLAYLSFLLYPGQDSAVGWRFYLFGAVGLILGVAVQKKRLPADNITLSLFTFFTTFIVYGGIMNLSSALLSANGASGKGISLEGLRILYVTGVPYDFFHALTAAVCVYFIGGNVIQKLERIKIKYGIYK